VNDTDYTFVSEEEFLRMAENGEFAEWAEVHGHLYGTSKKRLEELREAAMDVILDIDTQGAKKIRAHYDDGVYIFILPPSMDALRERLEKRTSNSPEEIDLRMKRASEEIRDYKSYDYVIVNNDFNEALTELKAIVLAEDKRTNKIDPQWSKETFKI
jgi:guanylate kinase